MNDIVMRLKVIILSALFVLFSAQSAYSKQYSPVNPVGYKPDIKSDEGGFWYAVDKIEKDVQHSSFTIQGTPLNTYVDEMVCRLAAQYCSDIRVYIINDPHFNASMYPNGMMHLHTGTLMRVASDDELAAILGHEIAHFLLTHQLEQWRSLKSASSLAAFADLALGGLATLAVGLNAFSHSRSSETDADLYGLQIMRDAGYKTEAAAQMWEYLEQERAADKTKRSKGASFFSTHPKTPKRARLLKAASMRYESTTRPEERQPSKQVPRLLHEMVSDHYQTLMQAQIATREFGQVETMLERHKQVDFPKHLVTYFEAELHRMRNQNDDIEKAKQLYASALSMTEYAMPLAHRELAYINVKQKNNQAALFHFKEYRKQAPNADDVAMSDYYIQSLESQIK